MQRRPPETVWYVARIGERVVGCYSALEARDFGQLWATDFYRVAGRAGTLAVRAMYRDLYARADAADLDLACTIDPANEPQLRAVLGREFEAIGVVCLRRKR